MNEEPTPTKNVEKVTNFLFYYDCIPETNAIRLKLLNLAEIIQINKYDFVFQMPTVHVMDTTKNVKPTIEKYINWRGKEREREVYPKPKPFPYAHYLVFSSPLTEKELEFWRIFKLGYLSHRCGVYL